MTEHLDTFDYTVSAHDAEILASMSSLFRPRFYLATPSRQTMSVVRPEQEPSAQTGSSIKPLGGVNDTATLLQIERNKDLVELLRFWIVSQVGEDDDDLEEQMHHLDAGRHSNQSLFQWRNH